MQNDSKTTLEPIKVFNTSNKSNTQKEVQDKRIKERLQQVRVFDKFFEGLETEYVLKTLQTVFYGYVPSNFFSEEPEVERHNLVFAYGCIIDFFHKVDKEGFEALEYLLQSAQVEAEQAVEVLDKMFKSYMLTEDFCGAREQERWFLYTEMVMIIEFFNSLLPKESRMHLSHIDMKLEFNRD